MNRLHLYMKTCLIPLLFSALPLVPLKAGSVPQLRTATGHPMQYYVSLPDNWNAKKKWPILVTIEGAGQGWLGNATGFAAARKDLPFIVVTPMVLTDVGRPSPEKYPYSKAVWDQMRDDPAALFRFDQEGILKIVDDVAKKYSGEQKFYLTGFSSGGHTAWSFIFAYPQKLAGAAVACANFRGRGVNEISNAPERVKLPIKAFFGAKDSRHPPEQWEVAKRKAEEHGYRNMTSETVPDLGHNPMASQVLSYFASLRH